MENSFNARSNLSVNGIEYEIFSLQALESDYNISRLPFCLKVLLENQLRLEDGVDVSKEDIEAIANWDPRTQPDKEIAFTPARVVLQDFTGVPAVVDLATMREAMSDLLQVIETHSIQLEGVDIILTEMLQSMTQW